MFPDGQKNNIEEMIERMVAKDGLAYSKFVYSKFHGIDLAASDLICQVRQHQQVSYYCSI